MRPKLICRKDHCRKRNVPTNKSFVLFLSETRDDPIKDLINATLKICKGPVLKK